MQEYNIEDYLIDKDTAKNCIEELVKENIDLETKLQKIKDLTTELCKSCYIKNNCHNCSGNRFKKILESES